MPRDAPEALCAKKVRLETSEISSFQVFTLKHFRFAVCYINLVLLSCETEVELGEAALLDEGPEKEIDFKMCNYHGRDMSRSV